MSENSARSSRLVLAGAVLGAVCAGVASTAFSWQLGGEPFDPAVGACVTWQQQNATDMTEVDCAKPHRFEVIGEIGVDGDDRPAEKKLQETAAAKCPEFAPKYLGNPLDPTGRYSVGALPPTQEQWDAGDRTMACGLRVAAPSNKLLATTGSARGADQSSVQQPGTCIGITPQRVPGDPVACTEPHAYEIVSIVDLGAKLGTAAPATAAQNKYLVEACAADAKSYAGGQDLAKFKLAITWDTLSKESWDAGSHKVNCKVGATPTAKGLNPVNGSVRNLAAGSSAQSASPTTTKRR